MARLLPVIPPHQSNDPTHERWKDHRDACVKEIDNDLRCRRPFEGWDQSEIYKLLKFHKSFLERYGDSMPINYYDHHQELIAEKEYGYKIPQTLEELAPFRTALVGEYQKIQAAKQALKLKAIPVKVEPGANYPTITHDDIDSIISDLSSKNIENVLDYLKHKIENLILP